MFRRAFLGSIIISLGFLIIPLVHAEWDTTWDYTRGAVLKDWQIQGLEVRQAADGLHIRGQGVMMHPINSTHPIDVVQLVFAKSAAVPIIFAWHQSGKSNDSFVSMQVNLNGTAPDQQLLPMHNIGLWDRWTDVIGFQIATEQEIVLSGIQLQGWSIWEKMWYAWKSFWLHDDTLSYTINFQWGPILLFTPPEIEAIFQTQPPVGWSVHRVSYSILILTGLLIFGYLLLQFLHRYPRSTRGATITFFTVFAILFGLHDIRMGYEFMHNAVKDLEDFSFAESGKRRFRNLMGFHDVLYRFTPLLTSVDRYMIFTPAQSPLKKMAAYHTYPHSRPPFDDESVSNVKVFFVYHTDEASVRNDTQLVHRDGTVLAGSGHIVERFDDNSFIFQVP